MQVNGRQLAIHYNLSNNENIKIPFTRFRQFQKIFYSLGIDNLISMMKDVLPFIMHEFYRMGCSELNSVLYYKLHVADNSSCSCGYCTENNYQDFFICQNYNQSPTKLHTIISIFNNNCSYFSWFILERKFLIRLWGKCFCFTHVSCLSKRQVTSNYLSSEVGQFHSYTTKKHFIMV